MPKAKKVKEVKNYSMEAENQLLREKIALLEKQQELQSGGIQSEINNIKRKAKPSANTIVVQEQIDHMNISLWTQKEKESDPCTQITQFKY